MKEKNTKIRSRSLLWWGENGEEGEEREGYTRMKQQIYSLNVCLLFSNESILFCHPKKTALYKPIWETVSLSPQMLVDNEVIIRNVN